MIVYNNTYNSNKPVGVGLGNFDGIHLGHASLIETLLSNCREKNISSMVYTFENHPNKVLFKDKVTPLIMTRRQKIEILDKKGVDILYFEYFDEQYASMSARKFVEEILVRLLHIELAVVGHNYSFGKKGEGSSNDLISFGKEYGFDVIVVPPVKKNGVVISSTLIREIVQNGDVGSFKELTGRLYSVPGTVSVGRKVGRCLGFPTANILPGEGFAIPKSGVYATKTSVDGVEYAAVTNIGNNPTFPGVKNVTIETHILDYNNTLYGKNIEVFFIERIRDEHKFDSAAALTAQISRDIKRAKMLFCRT